MPIIPKNLPKIEPELEIHPPRPLVWVARKITSYKITRETRWLLVNGAASRAWVTSYKKELDVEGTEHHVHYNFLDKKKNIIPGYFLAFISESEVAINFPAYLSWIEKAFNEKGTFTVLYDGNNPTNHVIYGTLQLFIPKSLIQITNEIQACPDNDKSSLRKLLEDFLYVALSPIGRIKQKEEKVEYYHLMENLQLATNGIINEHAENMEIIRKIIKLGKLDQDALLKLSNTCKKYAPGVWAAT
ncbi:MAG: hypothetical protein ACTSYS_00400 [Promethearchaeota archaeon]